MKRTDAYVRLLGVALSVIGFSLFLYPIADTVNMIMVLKLVFHANEVAAVALYAFILGATLSIFVIASNWLKQKPLIGFLLYAAVAVVVYFLLCFQFDKTIGPTYLMSKVARDLAGN